MGIILLVIGILLTADAAAAAVMLKEYPIAAFVIGIFFMLWGAFYKKFKNGNGFMGFLNVIFKLFFVYIIGMSCFLAVFGIVSDDADYREDYAVVLGSAIRDSRPGPALKSRLDTAADYCNQNPNAVIIVSGGRGWDENVSEASVMRDYLTYNGVDANRIVTEESASNTYENIKLSDEAVSGALSRSDVVLITNRFHIFRAKLYSGLYGIDVHTLAAPTKYYLVPVSYARETLAMVKIIIYYAYCNITK